MLLSRIRRKNSANSQSAFCTQSAVYILYLVCILNPVRGPRSTVCILYWPDWYCCFRLSEPQVRTEIMEHKKQFYTILAAMIDVFTVCWRAPEDKCNGRAMITLYQLKTNANARLAIMAASNAMLFCVVTACFEMNPLRVPSCRCEHFGFSIQVVFLEVQKCDLRLSLFLNYKNMLFLSTWVSGLHQN